MESAAVERPLGYRREAGGGTGEDFVPVAGGFEYGGPISSLVVQQFLCHWDDPEPQRVLRRLITSITCIKAVRNLQQPRGKLK